MTTNIFASPLKYFSLGLSTTLHILLLIFLFAQIYEHITHKPAELPEDDSVIFDDDQESENQDSQVQTPLPNTTLEQDILQTAQPESEISTPPEIEATPQTQTQTEPLLDIPRIASSKQNIKNKLQQARERWRTKKTGSAIAQEDQIPSKGAAQRLGAALQENFGRFKQAQQVAYHEKLAARGKTVDHVQRARYEYHQRILQAIKATTLYFVHHYYSNRALTTPKVHVIFDLDDNGKVLSIKLEPSMGMRELDETIKSFVMSTRFGRKPEILIEMGDEPYDFYVLPLPINQGDNILKLVACF